jgi:hypothetical protein
MVGKNRTTGIRSCPKLLTVAALWAFASQARATDGQVLTSLGQSGGLVIPYGFTLPEGTFEAQYNNYIDPRFGVKTTRSDVVWGAVGLFPYVEVSGGLANYPAGGGTTASGQDHIVLRHLMANVKVEVPKFFEFQPNIAFGITDIGGQTHYFRSKYGVVSQAIGPATFTVGYGRGDRLDGPFGGAELRLWNTGLSVLAEDDSKTPYGGIRYRSPPIKWLADASIVGTAMRSLKETNGVGERTSVSIGIQIPLEKRFDASRCSTGLCEEIAGAMSREASPQHPQMSREVIPSPSSAPVASDDAMSSAVGATASTSKVATSQGDVLPGLNFARVPPSYQKVDDRVATALSGTTPLGTIVSALSQAGLERIRAGVVGRDLVIEYENHRYNQNEADALGIVLGVAARYASKDIETVRVVIKKANEPIGEVSVERAAYLKFIGGGSPVEVGGALSMRTRPTYDADSIAWIGNSNAHSLVRVEIAPVTNYLYGTEYGNFDYSVGAKVQGFVPLWRGAELYSSVIIPLANSKNMDNGNIYSQYRLRGGLSSVALTQSFWIAPRVFNVTALGKFDLQYLGIENETTAFVPGRPDQVRLQLAYLHREPGKPALPNETTAVLTYRWVQPAWKMWVEAGAARYVGGDRGPLVTLTKWFNDVAFSVQAEHSGRGSFVGATISFPLTPRQGMKPGIVQVSGAEQFGLNFRTRVGSSNYIAGNAAETLNSAYDSDRFLLNQGRFSAEYFETQLYRMRDAYKRYVPQDTSSSE